MSLLRLTIVNIILFPMRVSRNLWSRRELIFHFTWRDFVGRYRGAHLGLVLSIVSPLFLLGVYTFAFGVFFKSPIAKADGTGPFALTLFSALVFYNFFNEAVSRAPKLLIENPNYITKVIFPVEILPVSAVGVALLHFMVRISILLGGIILAFGAIPLSVLWLPFVLCPLILLTLGICLFLSALGVFLRDISAIIPPLMMALLFASAIFFPISSMPDGTQFWLLLNPLACFSEMGKSIFIKNEAPSMPLWGYCMSIGLVCFFAGYAVFDRLKRSFSDSL